MSLDEIFNKNELEQYINQAISFRREQHGRINEMLRIELIECDIINQTVVYEFPLFNWEMNPMDSLHGGISATMMDLSLGLFANCICNKLGGFFSPTINMNINYLLPVSLQDKVIVKAQLVSSGSSILTLNGEMRTKSKNQLAVTSSASYKVMRK